MTSEPTELFFTFNGFVLNLVDTGNASWQLWQWKRLLMEVPILEDMKPSLVSLQPEVNLALFSNGGSIWRIDADLEVQLFNEGEFEFINLLGVSEQKIVAIALREGATCFCLFDPRFA